MAGYKVLQDIEAEDKLIGPFSLRQFIYIAIAVVSSFIAFKLATINLILITPFVPVIVLFGVLAAPFGHDQPSEVWLLARVRFFLKPHKRIWNQSGIVNLVTITVPKQIQRNLTKNLSETEVKSRLRALANTIDSRGWAIKNVNVNLSGQVNSAQIPSYSDRLIDPSGLPQDVPTNDITAADDILDADNNPTAQHLEQMIITSDQKHHQKVIDSMSKPAPVLPQTTPPGTDYWFMNDGPTQNQTPAGYASFDNTSLINPGDDPAAYSPAPQSSDDTALLEQIEHNKDVSRRNNHMHVVEPLAVQPPVRPQVSIPTPTPVQSNKTTTDPAIINLALANKDNWSIATIAHQAEQAKMKEPPQDEVIISLH